jgi:hypothetical protein
LHGINKAGTTDSWKYWPVILDCDNESFTNLELMERKQLEHDKHKVDLLLMSLASECDIWMVTFVRSDDATYERIDKLLVFDDSSIISSDDSSNYKLKKIYIYIRE